MGLSQVTTTRNEPKGLSQLLHSHYHTLISNSPTRDQQPQRSQLRLRYNLYSKSVHNSRRKVCSDSFRRPFERRSLAEVPTSIWLIVSSNRHHLVSLSNKRSFIVYDFAYLKYETYVQLYLLYKEELLKVYQLLYCN